MDFPTAIICFLKNIGTSEPISILDPHRLTCWQKTDFPCSTKGFESASTSMQ